MKDKKEEKHIFSKFLIVAIAALIIFLVYLCVKTYDESDIPKSLANISTTMTCVMASLSVIFTVVSINQSNKNRRVDRHIETRKRWYKDLVLDRHLHEIKKFFDECEGLTPILIGINDQRGNLKGADYDQKICEGVVIPFTKLYTALNRNVITDVGVIDGELAKQLATEFQKLQDGFLGAVEEKEINSDKFRTFLKSSYKGIMVALMQYDVEMR